MLVNQWSASDLGQTQDWTQDLVTAFEAFPQSRWSRSPGDQISFPLERYTRFERRSLAYYPYAWLAKLLLKENTLFNLFALRVVSVLITCGTIGFAYLSATRLLADSTLVQILVPWIILFNPSFMTTGSTVSDAGLAVLLSSIVFYLLLLEIEQLSWWRSGLALALTVLALWTKATTYFLVLVWGVLIVVYVWRLRRRHWLWLGIIVGLLIASLLLLPAKFERRLASSFNSLQSGLNTEGLVYVSSFTYLWSLVASYWIVLGWFIYPLAPIWYNVLFVFLLLAMIGLLLYVWRHIKQGRSVLGFEQNGLLLAALFICASVIVLVGYSAQLYGMKGRYGRLIFPAIVPFSLIMVAGWRALLPTKWQEIGMIFVTSFFVLFDTMVLLTYAVPWYYPFWPL